MNRAAFSLLALLPALSFAAGEPRPTEPADLGDLLREAEDNSPALRAAAARLESARRVPSQAQTPPDPEAGIAYTNDGLSGFTLGDREFSVLSLTWTQEVPYPGKLRQAGQVATIEAEAAAKALERARLDIAAEVKTAYADLYRIDRTTAILGETRSILESFAETARRRYEVGQGIQENILKAQTEILRLDAGLANLAQERRAAQVRLNAAVGRPADVPIGRAESLPDGDLQEDPESLGETAVTASPDIGILEASVRRSEASLRLARLNLKPDLVWSASYQYRGDLDPMIMGMFGLRLPSRRDRKQGQAVLQAESEKVAAAQDLADRQLRIRAAVRELVSRVERADRLLSLLGQGVIPQARITLESARASYSVGRLGFLDLLSDLTALLNAQIDEAAQEADRFQALAALEPLLDRHLIRIPAATPPAGGGGR